MITRREVWWASIVAAHHASWRLSLTIVAVTALPGGVLCAVSGIVFGTASARGVGLMLALFVLSPFVHELAHAIAHVLVATRERAIVAGVGRWSSGQIVRWQTASAADAVVAVAGPLVVTVAGIAAGVTLDVPFAVGYPIVVLFSLHLLTLRASAADGRELRMALTEERDA